MSIDYSVYWKKTTFIPSIGDHGNKSTKNIPRFRKLSVGKD